VINEEAGMNRSWDIFRTSANGMDADRGTARFNETRARTTHHDPYAAQHDYAPFGHPAHAVGGQPLARGRGPRGGDAGAPHRFDEHDATWWRSQGADHGRDSVHGGRGHDEPFSHHDHPSLWQRVKGAFHGVGPKNWKRSDERIHDDVCEQLCDHPYVDASDIEVIVRDGEVTLTGTVDARLVKRAAEDAAHAVRGVVDVHNQLRVRAPR